MKKILALLLALLTLLSFTTLCVGARATADETETNRYYFYKPDFWNDSEYSDTVGIYWWDSTDAPEAWPGYEAKKSDTEGVYYYDVPKDVTTIIWNNFVDGGMDPEAEIFYCQYQTTNIGTEYYDPEESESYPEGLASFDNMIYVLDTRIYTSEVHVKQCYNGEWYYYYGNGEYGITPEKGDKFYTESYREEPVTPETEIGTNRYYFYKPGFWFDSEYSDSVGIYWWEGTNSCYGWPGYEAKKADAEGVYYYDVPKDVTTIIWNNNLDGGFDPEADVYKYAYQTRNIGTEYYDPEESFVYPEGTTSFDGMIFVCNPISNVSGAYWEGIHALFGEWYYYYGNGEYGITPEKGEEFYTCSFQMDIATSASFDESLIPIDGDVNYDRKLSVRDATLIQKYIANIDRFDRVEMYLGDYNKDTIVNIKDATAIQKTLAKIY